MKRRRFKQAVNLEERLAQEAVRLRKEAELAPPAPSVIISCGSLAKPRSALT